MDQSYRGLHTCKQTDERERMASKGKHKYRAQWERFAEYLKTGERPDTFEEAYAVVCDKVSGLYESEARAMWNNIRKINPKSIVEIGRNLGGSQFLFCCAAQELEFFLSLDIEEFELTDAPLIRWGDLHGLDIFNMVEDSSKWQNDEDQHPYDLVFVDGNHTGPGVRADIEVWKDHCKWISFHDMADDNGRNKHRRYYPDVVAEISAAAERYGWEQFGERGRSDIVYRTGL
jgi:hypothetical protein